MPDLTPDPRRVRFAFAIAIECNTLTTADFILRNYPHMVADITVPRLAAEDDMLALLDSHNHPTSDVDNVVPFTRQAI